MKSEFDSFTPVTTLRAVVTLGCVIFGYTYIHR